MAYTKQDWVNGPDGGTPTSAARLNHMENGINDAHSRISDLLENRIPSLQADLDAAITTLQSEISDLRQQVESG